MTPSDELWIEMAGFDTDMSDGIWEGDAAPADSPRWYGRVATLVRVAKSPARADELAAEDEIVALMRQAVLEATAGSGEDGDAAPASGSEAPGLELVAAGAEADTEPAEPLEPVRLHAVESESAPSARPRHLRTPSGRLNGNRPLHMKARDEAAESADDEDDGDEPGRGGRIVRRLVAVKAVAATTAFVVGVTAAAAATGIVTVVVPAARDHLLPNDKDEPSHIVDDGGSGGDSDSGSRGGSGGTNGCAREGTACTTADGTRITPGTPGSGGTTGDPATDSTDAGADGSSTETTITGDGTTTDGSGDPTETTVPGDGATTTTTTTEEPPTTGTTTPTTEEPPTTEPTIQPTSDENAQGDATDESATSTSADLVQTMAAVDVGPADDSATDPTVSQG